MENQQEKTSKYILLWIAFVAATILLFNIFMYCYVAAADVTTKPQMKQGIYVIINSECNNKFNYLGTVKASTFLVDDPKNLLNTLLQKAKKDYPKCNAIIITEDDYSKADAIEILFTEEKK